MSRQGRGKEIAGVRVVVVIDPASTSASVYRTDELTIPEVLPGFSITVNQLFE